MTPEEFKELKYHVRVKYTGNDAKIRQHLGMNQPDFKNTTNYKKGFVVQYKSAPWKDTGGNEYRGTLILWGRTRVSLGVDDIKDWVVVDDVRADLQKKREQKAYEQAKEEIPRLLHHIFSGLRRAKHNVEWYLDKCTFSNKLKILSNFSPEEQKLYEMLSLEKETLRKILCMGYDKYLEEKEDESKGSTVPVSS